MAIGLDSNLTGIRKKVFDDRYALKDENGVQVEKTPEEMWNRVAKGIASVEKTPAKQMSWTVKFDDLLTGFKFVPAGRILSGAGTPHRVTYYNCYVIPSPEDSRGGILDNIKLMTEIMARGGGVGVNLSTLRPKGSHIKSVNGTASGPCSWAQLYSVATGDIIQQGGSRRGALMIMLDDDHPDIEEFVTMKRKPGWVEHANVSVAVSDAFMNAVATDSEWYLKWNGKVVKIIQARDLWNLLCESAWLSAEPGLVFIDRANDWNNLHYIENIRCVNPCGEQPLPPMGVCNLGALNLRAYCEGTPFSGTFDFEGLRRDVRTAVRFLDNVIDATHYFLEENERAQKGVRRIGLGTMGLADALIFLGIRYGSPSSLDFIGELFVMIRNEAYMASVDLARERGPFPALESGNFLEGRFTKTLPHYIRESIMHDGIRNGVLLTQAPTGTTSLLAGVSSGIEPVFDFQMVRRDRTGEHVLYHPLWEKWAEEHPFRDFPSRPDFFVKSNDLTPEEHVAVQATIQYFTDASISKTVNAPNSHTVEDVKNLYQIAYNQGCKGVTYYRDGSRDAVLTHGDEKPKVAEESPTIFTVPPTFTEPTNIRPSITDAHTHRVETPVGTAFVTWGRNPQTSELCECFITVGHGGSDLSADAEAIGRLISLVLRTNSAMDYNAKVDAILDQLAGIGGRGSVGFGESRVRSLADGIAQTLRREIDALADTRTPVTIIFPKLKGLVSVDLCPQCGTATLVHEEGCAKCHNCGYSAC